MVGVVAFIVLVEGGQRRIPVQYAKRVVGRRVMGGQSSYLPLRVNSGGVIPPIFASSLLAFPATIALVLGAKYAFIKTFANAVNGGEPLYTVLYVTMILLFAFFYVGIVFNPTELADNMRKNGGFIPGIRPGRNHQRIRKQDLEASHFDRRHLSRFGLLASGMDDRRNSPEPFARAAWWQLV